MAGGEEKESCGCQVCPGQIEVPTERERAALAEMRAIKERVRVLKGSLDSIQEKGGDRSHMVKEIETTLASLKAEWERWEEERNAAAQERMRLLGHDETV